MATPPFDWKQYSTSITVPRWEPQSLGELLGPMPLLYNPLLTAYLESARPALIDAIFGESPLLRWLQKPQVSGRTGRRRGLRKSATK